MTAIAPMRWRATLQRASANSEALAVNAGGISVPSKDDGNPRIGKQTIASQKTAELESLLGKYGSLVQRAASRLSRRGRGAVEQADLEHEGLLGLIEAWQTFQQSRGVPFYAYARLRVRGAMIDNIRRQARAPRRSWTRMRNVDAMRTELENRLGRKARPAELAEHCRLPPGALPEQELCHRRVQFMDELPETIDEAADVEEAVARSQLASTLNCALGYLTERQREVTGLYYCSEMNQLQIGELLELSESRVSQIRTQALDRLRKAFRRQGVQISNPLRERNREPDINEAIQQGCPEAPVSNLGIQSDKEKLAYDDRCACRG